MRGFFVPDHVRKDAEDSLLKDTAPVIEQWSEYCQNNWYSDMTPNMRYTSFHRLIPLEIFNVYSILRPEAWERYFYNEVFYSYYTEEDFKAAQSPFGTFNFDRDEGKRAFEAEVKKFIDLYPGTIVKQGEEFNFKEFYAKQALLKGKDTSKLDSVQADALRQKLTAKDEVSSLNLPADKVGKSILGTVYPKELRSKNRKVMM